MSARALFLTHGDVVIDPAVPVPQWGLNAVGRARHEKFAASDICASIGTIFCSDERKAQDGAQITQNALGLIPRIRPNLGENDRSATGYLPKDEFEQLADAFFAHLDISARGWATARAEQSRIVDAVDSALSEKRPEGDVLFVSHGAVAALLRCHLLGCEISRSEDQTGNGGCWFAFDPDLSGPPTDWSVI